MEAEGVDVGEGDKTIEGAGGAWEAGITAISGEN